MSSKRKEKKVKKAKKEKPACVICCEEYTLKNRKPISCYKCKEECCLICFRRYLLESPSAKCMFKCGYVFLPSFVMNNTPKAYHNKQYRNHRAKVELSFEKSLIPSTQEDAAEYKKAKEQKEKYKREISESKLLRAVRYFNHHIPLTERVQLDFYDEVMALCISRYGEVSERYFNNIANEKLSIMHYNLSHLHVRYTDTLKRIKTGKDTKKVIGYRFKCTKENCNGWYKQNSRTLICLICEKKACNRCFKDYDKKHKCKAEDVETVKLIKRESKPCPKCGVSIGKINGCDQMWCVNCHTPFSWNKGTIIVRGTLHNPHYIQWARENKDIKTNADLNHCGDNTLPRFDIIYRGRIHALRSPGLSNLALFHTRLIETDDVNLRREVLSSKQKKRMARIRFIVNEIDEKQWFNSLKRITKDDEYYGELESVRQTLITIGKDIFRSVYVSREMVRHETTLAKLNSALDFFNEKSGEIAKAYGRKPIKFKINEPWNLR